MTKDDQAYYEAMGIDDLDLKADQIKFNLTTEECHSAITEQDTLTIKNGFIHIRNKYRWTKFRINLISSIVHYY